MPSSLSPQGRGEGNLRQPNVDTMVQHCIPTVHFSSLLIFQQSNNPTIQQPPLHHSVPSIMHWCFQQPRLSFMQRQPDPKCCSTSHLAVHLDVPVVGSHNALHDH